MRTFVPLCTIWIPLVLVVTCTGHCQEWTRFRGPNGQGLGQAEDLPAQWTDADYNWKVALPGQGHSSPVLWGDRIFLMSADPETAARMVLCLSAVDGRQLWRREFSSSSHHLHQRNTYASTTPAVDSERVYVAWSTPDKVTLMALDQDGGDVWSRDLGSWTSQHGFGTSPMLFQDMVVLSNNQQAQQLEADQTPGESHVMAFDVRTGQDRWRARRVAVRVCYSTPCIYHPPGGSPQLVCTSTGDGVYALDPRSGRELWNARDALRMRVVSSPLVAGGLVFGSTGSGGGGNYVVAVRPGRNAEVAYTIRSSAPYVPSIVAKDGLMYLFYDRGVVTCADVKSGSVRWRERLSDGFSGSPVIADGKVYCIGDDGVVYVLAASDQFRLLGENALGEPTRSTPAVARGQLYLRTLSHLFSIGG
jgi:outer membrane protein assembly factor BamB